MRPLYTREADPSIGRLAICLAGVSGYKVQSRIHPCIAFFGGPEAIRLALPALLSTQQFSKSRNRRPSQFPLNKDPPDIQCSIDLARPDVHALLSLEPQEQPLSAETLPI